jgi:hypothetical protein
MEKTKILQDILVLLKAAKTAPEQFALLLKDDQPHPANSPEDKAHDVKEENESLKQALSLLDTPEKRSKMLEHLRSLQEEADLRSPENQEVGQEHMEKQSNPLFAKENEKGVHKPHFGAGKKTGTSDVGARLMSGVKPSGTTKDYIEKEHKRVLSELKDMKKPNLPKSEKNTEKGDKDMNKSEKTALELAKELLKAAQENPEQFEELSKAISPAAAPAPKMGMPKPKMSVPKPPKMQAPPMMKEEKEESEEDEKEEDMEKARIDEGKTPRQKMHAREARAASSMAGQKTNPLSPHLEYGRAIKDIQNKLPYHDKVGSAGATLRGAAASARVSAKEAQRQNISQERKIKPNLPKIKKDMEKADKDMEKCGSMKMSKKEIKEDLKKEWKPKYKKG